MCECDQGIRECDQGIRACDQGMWPKNISSQCYQRISECVTRNFKENYHRLTFFLHRYTITILIYSYYTYILLLYLYTITILLLFYTSPFLFSLFHLENICSSRIFLIHSSCVLFTKLLIKLPPPALPSPPPTNQQHSHLFDGGRGGEIRLWCQFARATCTHFETTSARIVPDEDGPAHMFHEPCIHSSVFWWKESGGI